MTAAPQPAEPRIIAICGSYSEILEGLRTRLAELGISYETLDQIAGWSDTYSTKVLSPRPTKTLGPASWRDAMGGLAFKVALVHDPEAYDRVLRSRHYKKRSYPPQMLAVKSGCGKHTITSVKFLRKMAGSGGVARSAKLSKRRRRQIAKKAAKARWSKPTVVELDPAARAPDTSPAEAPRVAQLDRPPRIAGTDEP